MSLWQRRELRVALSPEQVLLLGVRCGLRGVRPSGDDAQLLSFHGAASPQPWRSVVLALENALGRAPKLAATVILSNHFVRYVLVPWREGLDGEGEALSYARHCFTKVYGKGALQWQIRLSEESAALPRLACAVDGELIEALKGAFESAGIVLQSIQPHLMAAFNGTRRHLHRSAWFALIEPGLITLALLQEGCWQSVRNVRVDGSWRDELPIVLEREAYCADSNTVPRQVYVWNADAADGLLPKGEGWKFYGLTPAHPVGSPVIQTGPFAMATAG